MSSRPLNSTVVVDLSRYLPGPLTARMLANLGARVIKVEEPRRGDPVRGAEAGGGGGLAELLLGGVESVALDLRSADGRRALASLLERADVLLESFRPGKLAEFGFPLDELRAAHPGLVVCSISGWGDGGPWARRAGHDLAYQAAAGALASTGGMPNLPSADLLGAFAAVAAIAAALAERAVTGRGSRIDASLYDAARIAAAVQGGLAPLAGGSPCYRIYTTADGRGFALAALEPHFWRTFCEVAGRPDLEPLQYASDRRSHATLEELFAGRDADAWAELCSRHDLPGELVRTFDEAAEAEQATAREIRIDDGRLPFPARLDGERPNAAAGAPTLGEHTQALLEALSGDAPDLD